MGDVLNTHVYSDSDGPAVLLLAAGQRIDSPAQLRILKDAGFAVDFTAPSKSAPGAPAVKTTADSGLRAQQEFESRTQSAQRVRAGVTKAAGKLRERLRSGQEPEFENLLPASAELAANVVSDPYAAAAITYLTECHDYIVEHSADVAILMVAIGTVLNRPEGELKALGLAGLLHDVGMQHLSTEILEKPGPLDPAEWREIRKHPMYGYHLLRRSDCPKTVPIVAKEHHERADGSGYPDGLHGVQIHAHSRIAAVADSFAALTSTRPYRTAISAWRALSELVVQCRGQYDQQVVLALTRLVGVFPIGTKVQLDSGESGVVVAPNPEDGSRPVLRIDRDRHGHALGYSYNLELCASKRRIVSVQS